MKTISKSGSFFLAVSLLAGLANFQGITGQPVDAVLAEMVAKNFFADRLSRSEISKLKGISPQDLLVDLIHEEKAELNNPDDKNKGAHVFPVYYVFNIKDKTDLKSNNGFIIISADQRVPLVLGYSFAEGYSENDQASAFKYWMDNYKKQIVYAVQSNLKPDPEVTEAWKKYSGTIDLKGAEQLAEVTPLLSTQWNQNGYSNNHCPADEACINALNGHVPAGCVAVAMAQIMKRWNYPDANNPIPGYYSTNYGWQNDIPATLYNWSSMRDNIDFFNPNQPTSDQIEAVSTLVYHCGVAVQMKYGAGGSGAGSPVNAFVDYFKYSAGIQDVDRSAYTDSDWGNMLRSELNDGRPVYYSGYKNDQQEEGHAFVCDGYQDVDPYFHFNWGLGPGPDGYYYLNDLTPGSHDFRFMQWAIIGITPGSGSTISDADGNHYNIVTIDTQTWMVENLKTTKYNDGTGIAHPGTDNNAWLNTTSGAYAWYDNDIANKDPYGALYNWYAVNTGKLCPAGWHVPTDDDWKQLETFLGLTPEELERYSYFRGTDEGGKLKEAGTDYWQSPNNCATNTYGFDARPGGFRIGDGWYDYKSENGFWWTSSKNDEYNATGWSRYLNTINCGVFRGITWVNDGFSVRCLMGELVEILPGDAGAYAYGYIGSAAEEKWYKLMTGPAGSYVIQTYGNTDTYMYIYNSEKNTILAEDNNGGEGAVNSRIVHDLAANTVYYVKIRGNDSSVKGGYSINFVPLPAAPAAEDQIICTDGTGNQTLTATATAPEGSVVVWFTTPDGLITTENPVQAGVGTITYYAASYNEATDCYSATRTPVTLTINGLPSAGISGTAVICEGTSAVLSLSLTGEPPWTVTYNAGSAPVTISGIPESPYPITVAPLATTTYSLVAVSDAKCTQVLSGLSATVTINSNPEITGITSSQVDPVPLLNEEATVYFTGEFSDADGNLRTVTFDFGDGSVPEIVELGGTETALQVSHTYSSTGVFVVEVSLSDGCSSVSMPYNYVVIYDPAGGFVTGGGWIDSPAGAYVPDPAMTGKATFGFESGYKKGASIPAGNTEFQFHAAGMKFKSQSYEWLVVSGLKARFKGSGTINGAGIYGFMLSATDGSPDKFRIRIWDRDTETTVYDNEMNVSEIPEPLTAISGGSITVHNPKDKYNMMASDFGIKAYPNPFSDHIFFDIRLMGDSEVTLEIFDADGSKIATVYNDIMLAYENYTFEYIPENLRSGLLLYRFTVNGKQMFSGTLIHH